MGTESVCNELLAGLPAGREWGCMRNRTVISSGPCAAEGTWPVGAAWAPTRPWVSHTVVSLLPRPLSAGWASFHDHPAPSTELPCFPWSPAFSLLWAVDSGQRPGPQEAVGRGQWSHLPSAAYCRQRWEQPLDSGLLGVCPQG